MYKALLIIVVFLTGCAWVKDNPDNIIQNQTVTIKLYIDGERQSSIEVVDNRPIINTGCGLFEYKSTIVRPPTPTVNKNRMSDPNYVIDLLTNRTASLNQFIDLLLEDYDNQYKQFLKNCVNDVKR